MKIAVKKEVGSVPGGGFHYMLHPIKMQGDFEAQIYEQIGYIVFDVIDSEGERMLLEAGSALKAQLEVAYATEKFLEQKSKLK